MTPSDLRITDVTFQSASATQAQSGLLGWVALNVNDHLRLDGLTLRRTLEGRLALSFPARRDASGRKHPIVRPLDDLVRREVEFQVLAALGLDAEGA